MKLTNKTKSFFLFIFILQTFILFHSCVDKHSFAREELLSNIFRKKDITIAITDSGLGGLSIAADLAERMREAKIFRSVKIVFFNALFSNEGGYNSLSSREMKIRIFDSSLHSLERKYTPNLILIGCNTLSVLFDDTSFARQTQTPVAGIVDKGVDMIARSLKSTPESRVIIFATQTTIEEGIHKKRLVEKGFLDERVITQSCPDLVTYIEKEYNSDETEMLIFAYVDEALQKIPYPRTPLFVSFNCTHYGYSLSLWEKAFQSFNIKPLAFLNPNSRMIDFLFPPEKLARFKKTDISVHVVSMVEITKNKIKSIGEWLNKISPQTAEALPHYELNPELFEWKSYLDKER
ncbi:MAG: aspartate/glutamate racemase family protein [Acidobacteriota bacterium]|nr:aspartate/glutamate racemase family protein [Acidobacteriota bacterium]